MTPLSTLGILDTRRRHDTRAEFGATPSPQAVGPAPTGPGQLMYRSATYGTGTSTGPTTSMLSYFVLVRYCTTSIVADLGSPYSLKSSGPVTPS